MAMDILVDYFFVFMRESNLLSNQNMNIRPNQFKIILKTNKNKNEIF